MLVGGDRDVRVYIHKGFRKLLRALTEGIVSAHIPVATHQADVLPGWLPASWTRLFAARFRNAFPFFREERAVRSTGRKEYRV